MTETEEGYEVKAVVYAILVLVLAYGVVEIAHQPWWVVFVGMAIALAYRTYRLFKVTP